MVDFFIPPQDGVIFTFDSIDDAEDQELVVVGEEGCGQLWFHDESSTESIEEELDRGLRLAGMPLRIHIKYIDTSFFLNPRLIRHQVSRLLHIYVNPIIVLVSLLLKIRVHPQKVLMGSKE